MTPAEANGLLDVLLQPSPVTTYVEWGSGGSTELISWLALSGVLPKHMRAVSLESSRKWSDYLRARSNLVSRAEQQGSVSLLSVSYGAQKAYGHPVQSSRTHPSTRARAAKYVAAPFANLTQPVDVALVDGRFRVACALEVLKHATATTRVLVHDYGKSRQRAECAPGHQTRDVPLQCAHCSSRD
jgi:hypothetical protein